jgi:predicted RNase H-like HicB family nuclease/DNA-binding XRE family transcriptional regulator
MRFRGRIVRDGKFWFIEVPALNVMTQGHTRKEALEMIADAIESLVNESGFKVDVYAKRGEGFEVGSADTSRLTAFFLKRRRQASGLTLKETAKRLGIKSHNAYARYEQGKTVPTIEKLNQLLSVVDAGSDYVLSRSQF